MRKFILICSLALLSFLTACSEIEPKPFVPSTGHINAEVQPTGEIPELVTQAPVLPAPAPAAELEKYTVVVNEVPVKELLFALARDAQVNVDIDPKIEGVVTINAVEQTLPQILDRIAYQVDLRYEFSGDNLRIEPDTPILRTYTIDYVNMSRDTSSTNTVATQISSTSGGGESGSIGGGNNSTTDVTSISNHHFWESLVLNISAILGEVTSRSGGGGDQLPITNTVIPNPEAGIIMVRARATQHQQIQEFIDQTQERAQRQVLIRVTIAEVQLSDQYQAGIDWSILQSVTKAGINIISTTLTGVPVGTISDFIIEYQDPNDDRDNKFEATVRLLDEFGNVRIMSSPQIMVLNNQTAMLKVVENVVYFEIESEVTAGVLGSEPIVSVNTTAVTVPEGIVMTVTPQISSNNVISLNVRPTISRITEFVPDPNPEQLVDTDGAPLNQVPQIVIREIESMLRLTDGQVGVLGGLMQDESRDNVDGLPGVSDAPGIGAAFKTTTKEYKKTELVIFIQPTIIQNPSLDGDLASYRQYLNPSRESLLPEPRNIIAPSEGSEAQ